MHIGDMFFASLAYCAILGAFYILFYGFSSHLFVKIKIYYEVVLGFLIGVISIFAIMAFSNVSKSPGAQNHYFYWELLMCIMTGIFISPYAMYPTIAMACLMSFLLPSYAPDLFSSTLPSHNDTILLAVSYIGIGIGISLMFFLVKNRFKNLTYLFSTTIIIVAMVISMLARLSDVTVKDIWVLICWYLSGLILFVFAFLTDRVHNHAIRLREIIENEDEFFVASTGVQKKFQYLIQKEKIHQGILFSYFITQYDLLDTTVSVQIRDFLWKNITHQVQKKFKSINERAFFFHDNYKTDCVFIPIEHISAQALHVGMKSNMLSKRLPDDIFKKYADIFNGITQNYYIGKYRISVKVRAVASIYGIQSANFTELVENNAFYVQNKEKLTDKNIIYVVENENLVESQYEMRKLKSLNALVGITSSSILYEPIYSIKSQNIAAHFLNYIVDGNVVFPLKENKEQISMLIDYGQYSTFFRTLAYKALKNSLRNKKSLDKKIVFLFYDSKFISSSSFSTSEFIAKIKKTGWQRDNIALTFDVNGEIENPEVLAKNIIKLKSSGFRVALLNISASSAEFTVIPHYQPDYLILDQDLVSGMVISKENREIISGIIKVAKKIEAITIAQGVKSFLNYKTLQGIGIDAIYGELVGSSTVIKEELPPEQKILLQK